MARVLGRILFWCERFYINLVWSFSDAFAIKLENSNYRLLDKTLRTLTKVKYSNIDVYAPQLTWAGPQDVQHGLQNVGFMAVEDESSSR